MTLVDTSAWIEFLRRDGDLHAKNRVASLIDVGEATIRGPIEFELLAGARPKEIGDLREAISLCRDLEFSTTCWRRAADLERALRTKGVTVPRDDVFVAAAALTHRVPLYSCDGHFELMATKGAIPLQLD